MKNIITLLIIVIVLISCDSPLDFDPISKETAEQVVVNATIETGSVPGVHLSLSRSVLKNTPYANIENATITIGNNGTDQLLLYQGNGVYQGTEPIVSNTSYDLHISVNGFDLISAREIAPAQIDFLDLEVIENAIYTDNGSVSLLELTIQDDPLTENYYELIIYQMKGDSINFMPMHISDIHITNVSAGSILSQEDESVYQLLLTDELFNGQEFSLETQFYKFDENAPVVIHLKSLSENYYDYLFNKHLTTKNNLDPLSEPISTYSNIENGIGIFAGYSYVEAVR
ncbi:MAG: DUF4249 domain-containing protein [Cyclobacteriaceae bacterium]